MVIGNKDNIIGLPNSVDLENINKNTDKFKAEIKIDSSLPFLEGIHQMSATIYAMKTRRNIMVDALNPEMPNSGTEALTANQQRFEQAVDSAYRQFYSGLDSRGPAPVSLLSYASGSLSGTDRERFERESAEADAQALAIQEARRQASR